MVPVTGPVLLLLISPGCVDLTASSFENMDKLPPIVLSLRFSWNFKIARDFHSIFQILYICCGCLVAKLYLTLCDPMDYSPPGSSVHGIPQARVLEWLAISSSRGPFRPRGQTCVSSVYLHSQEASLLLAPPGKPTVYYISNLNENLRWFNLIHIFSVGTYFWSKFPNSLISNQVEYLYLLPERTAPLP